MAQRKTKSFTSLVKKNEDVQPIKFELLEEEFTAYPEVPGAVLLEFIASADDNSSSTAKGLLNYLKASMEDEEYKRFDKLIKDPKNIIDISVISEIVSYLIEEQSTRPTEAS